MAKSVQDLVQQSLDAEAGVDNSEEAAESLEEFIDRQQGSIKEYVEDASPKQYSEEEIGEYLQLLNGMVNVMTKKVPESKRTPGDYSGVVTMADHVNGLEGWKVFIDKSREFIITLIENALHAKYPLITASGISDRAIGILAGK